MGLLSKVRIHKCVYWGPPVETGLSRNFPLAVEYSCRWDDEQQSVRTLKNEQFTSNAAVLMSGEVVVGGYLWLGSLDDLKERYPVSVLSNPKEVHNAFEIQHIERTPMIRNRDHTDLSKTALWAYL